MISLDEEIKKDKEAEYRKRKEKRDRNYLHRNRYEVFHVLSRIVTKEKIIFMYFSSHLESIRGEISQPEIKNCFGALQSALLS